MSSLLVLPVAVVGAALGFFFYGGLWWTVRRLPRAAHPVTLMIASYWVRLTVTVCAFILLAKFGFASVAIALSGFILGRLVVSRLLAPRSPKCT